MTNNLINFISDSLDLEYEVNVVTDGDSETLVLYDGVECVDYETIDNHTFLKDSYLGGFCGITSIVIPKTVTNINCNALNKCKWLESIVVSDDNETYSSQDGVLYDKNKTKLYYVPPKVKLTELVLPDTVTEIAEKAFDCCKNLKSVVIPSSVKRIGGMAFSHCLSLESVVIPDSINVIDYGTFISCRNLKSINIPNSVTRINDSAFHSTGLESVVIPDSVIEIEARAFRYSKLTNVSVPKNTIVGEDAFECFPY